MVIDIVPNLSTPYHKKIMPIPSSVPNEKSRKMQTVTTLVIPNFHPVGVELAGGRNEIQSQSRESNSFPVDYPSASTAKKETKQKTREQNEALACLSGCALEANNKEGNFSSNIRKKLRSEALQRRL